VSEELVTFGGRTALIWKGVQTAVLWAFAVGIVHFHFLGRSAGAIAFAVVCIVGGCYDLLWNPFEATLDGESLVFRSIVRTKAFNIEDLRRVKRHIGAEGSGTSWRFSFARGSAWLNGSSGERLAKRLFQLKPTIANDAMQ
jgi:hypothetical protein